MDFSVLILGSNSAIPTLRRHPSAQVVHFNQVPYLIDCGEGTQLQMRKYRIKFQKIRQIFISHLHGDHYYGLPGLLTSMHLLGREKELKIYAPKGLEEIIQVNFKHSGTVLRYPLEFIELTEANEGYIYSDERVKVRSVSLNHRVPTFGFVFEECEHELRVNKEAIEKYALSLKEILMIKAREEVYRNNLPIPTKELWLEPQKLRSYAYCSDTAFHEPLIDKIRGVNLLYHEATFMEDLKHRAKETYHSTAKQAGEIATRAEVGKLLIGHFSTRYDEIDGLLNEAQSVFEASELALEGTSFKV